MISTHLTKEELVRKLRESQENLKTYVEDAPDGIYLADLKGTFLYGNKQAEEITGYTKQELIGKSFLNLNLLPSKYLPKAIKLLTLNAAGKTTGPDTFELVRKDGRKIWIEIKTKTIEQFGKTVVIGFVRDITERKRAEEALKKNEARYRGLFETMPSAVAVYEGVEDGNDFIFREFNTAGERMEELRREKVIGKKVTEVFPGVRAFGLFEVFQRVWRTGFPEYFAPVKYTDERDTGSWRENWVYKLPDGEIVAVYNDVTARKLAEIEREKLARFPEENPNPVLRIDNDGMILYGNRASLPILKMWERRQGDILPADWRSKALSILQSGKPEITEVEYEGTIYFMALTPITGTDYLNIYVRNITGQKRAENDLKNSEERFRRLAENARDIIFRYRQLPSLGFDYISPAVLRISGYAPEEFYADPLLLFKVVHPDSRSLLEEITSRPQDYLDKPVVLRWVHKDGEIIWTEQRSVPIYDKDGKITATEGIIRDITERKQMDEVLRISEENYRNSVDSSPMGMVVFDGNQEILYANQATLDIYGFKNIEELRNTPIKERYTPESYAEYLVRSNKFKSGEVASLGYELSIRRKDGTIRHLQALRKEIIWGGEKQFQVRYNDITERKKAEDAMRESRARFRELARLLPLAIWETDANGTLTYTNEEAMRVYGYSRQDVAPSYLQNLIPQDRDRAARNTQRLLQGETLGGIEYTGLIKDGSTFPVMIYGSAIFRNGKSVGLRGITINTTEQKKAEKRLEQAAQEWRTTFDSITDMVCILDNNFRIVRVNRSYAKMLKKEPQELLGKVCYEMIHKTDCPRHDCPHQETLQTGKPAMAEYFEPTWGFYVEASTSPIFNENGDVKGSVCVIRDINERRRMQEQLMQTDRLASVGELASGVAHELNNPLTTVIGFSQLLLERKIPDDIKEDLSLINSEALRAASVVKNLLTFARKHAPAKQLCQMHNIIEDVLKLRAYEQKVNNIEVIKKFASDLPEIMVDYFQIQQVFLNLIINAEFFMIEAHRRGTLTISIEKVDNAVKVSFADDGPGIPRENLKRIFDPFFTTKEVGKGTGLGLSICHGIITEHSGKIYAESEVGKGATFIIELPINGR